MNAGAQTIGTKMGGGEVGGGEELQHLKDKRNNCQRSDGLWGTEAGGAGGGRHGLKKRRMRKRRSSSSSMRGDFSTAGIVSWRSAEAEGGTEGGAAAYVSLRPHWNDAPARAKKTKPQNRLTMFMHCLLAEDGLSTNTAATINTSPYLCFAAGSYTEPAGASGTTATTLAADPHRKCWRQTSGKQTCRLLFESTNQTSPFPAFHGAEGRREGRTGRPGSLYYTFNEIL